MDDLVNLRNRIDSIDEEIMRLIEKRFHITNQVGLYKRSNGIKVNHPSREDEILEKCKKYNYSIELTEIYKKMFDLSKKNQ